MGNEASSQQPGIPTILCVEAILWPNGEPVCCYVSIRKTNEQAQLLGEVWQFPGRPIAVWPNSITDELVLSFKHAGSPNGEIAGENLASLIVSISSLVQFGAPLFTSMWLGLQVGGEDTAWDLGMKYAKEPNMPKVRISFFRPSKKSFKELQEREADALKRASQNKQPALPDPIGWAEAEPDTIGALAAHINGASGHVGEDYGPSLAQQVNSIITSLRVSNETVWALQSAYFEKTDGLSALPEPQLRTRELEPPEPQLRTRELTVSEPPSPPPPKDMRRARIRVTIDDVRGEVVQNMECICEVPGYSVQFQLPGVASDGNMAVGSPDYAECEAYPVSAPLRFTVRPKEEAGSTLEPMTEPFAWCDLESKIFYPNGYRGDLMLLDKFASARGTVKVRIEVLPEEPREGEIPYNEESCQFELQGAPENLRAMMIAEGLDSNIDAINQDVLGDFSKKWGRRSIMSSFFSMSLSPKRQSSNALPMPTPLKLESRSGSAAILDQRKRDWTLVEHELLEYLPILNAMLSGSSIAIQLYANGENGVYIKVKWQPQELQMFRETQKDGLQDLLFSVSAIFTKFLRERSELLNNAVQETTAREEFARKCADHEQENSRLKLALDGARAEVETHKKAQLELEAIHDLALSRERETEAVLQENRDAIQRSAFSESNLRARIEQLESIDTEALFDENAGLKSALDNVSMEKAAAVEELNVTTIRMQDMQVKMQEMDAMLADASSRETTLKAALDQANLQRGQDLDAVFKEAVEQASVREAELQAKFQEACSELDQAAQRQAELEGKLREYEGRLLESENQDLAWKQMLAQTEAAASERERAMEEKLRIASQEQSSKIELTTMTEVLQEQLTSTRKALDQKDLELKDVSNEVHALQEMVKKEQGLKDSALNSHEELFEKVTALDEMLQEEQAQKENAMRSLEISYEEVQDKETRLQAALQQVQEKDEAMQASLAKEQQALVDIQLIEEQIVKREAAREAEIQQLQQQLAELQQGPTPQMEAQAHAVELQLLEQQFAEREQERKLEVQRLERKLAERESQWELEVQHFEQQLAERDSARELQEQLMQQQIADHQSNRQIELEQLQQQIADLESTQGMELRRLQQEMADRESAQEMEMRRMQQQMQQQTATRGLEEEDTGLKVLNFQQVMQQLQEDLEQQRAAASFHKQAAVSGTEQLAIKDAALKEAARREAYMKELADREAELKEVALQDAAEKDYLLQEEQRRIAELEALLQQVADRDHSRDVEEKWQALQRQLQGTEMDLQQSQQAQSRLEEQLAAATEVKRDSDAQKEELLAKVRILEMEMAKAKSGLQGESMPPSTMPDMAQLHLQAELEGAKQMASDAVSAERNLQDAKYSAMFMELVKTRQDLEFERSKSAQTGDQAEITQNLEAHSLELEMLRRQLEKEKANGQAELVMGHRNEMRDLQRRQDEALSLIERKNEANILRLKARFAEAMRLQSKGGLEQALSQQVIAQLQAGIDDCTEATNPATQPPTDELTATAKGLPSVSLPAAAVNPPFASAAPSPMPEFAGGRPVAGPELRSMSPTSSPSQPGREFTTPVVYPVIQGAGSTQQFLQAAPGTSPMNTRVIQIQPATSFPGPLATVSPPATFDCAIATSSTRMTTPPQPSVRALSSSRRQPAGDEGGRSPSPASQPALKKATVRCIQCTALNMIQLEGPPTIQCGGCGFEFQVDPNGVSRPMRGRMPLGTLAGT